MDKLEKILITFACVVVGIVILILIALIAVIMYACIVYGGKSITEIPVWVLWIMGW